jgi:hypothetical protein
MLGLNPTLGPLFQGTGDAVLTDNVAQL